MMFLFIDTETTGLPDNRSASVYPVSNWPRLVEIAWIECQENGTIVSEYNQIIKPDAFKIPKKASAIHGITTGKAKKYGVLLQEVLTQLFLVIGRSSLLIGHNIEFDTKVIQAEFFRAGFLKNHFLELCNRQVCTMKSSARFCRIRSGHGQYKYPKLSELYEKLFGECYDCNHSALSDAHACMNCYFELKGRGVL
jgi:DNA polymerase III epsilon subunit-like protein